jgi:hypothetical protein
MNNADLAAKQHVHDFWTEAACGENLDLQTNSRESYHTQAAEHYRLEACILSFADFAATRGMALGVTGLRCNTLQGHRRGVPRAQPRGPCSHHDP